MKVRFTKRALRDLVQVHDWIALRNPAAARRVEAFVREASRSRSDFPMIGAVTDLAQVRRLPLVRYPYTMYYRINQETAMVEILRIVHSAQIRVIGKLPNATH